MNQYNWLLRAAFHNAAPFQPKDQATIRIKSQMLIFGAGLPLVKNQLTNWGNVFISIFFIGPALAGRFLPRAKNGKPVIL